MATDHFIRHKWAKTRTDWNFNILFNDQPQVAAYAQQFHYALKHPGLYQAVPSEWFHATLLRVGFLEDFSETEMLEVAKRLETKFAAIQMPEFLLGQWWLWGGNPCVHFTPEEPLNEMFKVLVDELTAVVGRDRLPGELKFTPHITLAYSKTYDDENGLFQQLQGVKAKAVPISVKRVSLIKQHVENNYYVWEVVKDIDLRQQ
ncbi:MAG: 2'-5' RNA ligase family protein [Candidatus Saccharimonadales bacterium]